MKFSSVIFIVIGVCSIIAGLILCTSADAAAKEDGYNLHEGFYDAEGNISEKFPFGISEDVDISKISVELDGVDVEIIGGSARSEIICENLTPGTYASFVSNKVITFTNILDSSTILDALSSIEFDGIRKFFDPEIFKPKPKKVYVYINEESEIIKQLSLELNNCNVNVKNVTGSLDFRVKATNSNLTFTDCQTDSSINCEITKSELKFINFEFNRSEFIFTDSKFDFDSTLFILHRFNIVSDKTIVVNGENFEGDYNLYMEYDTYPLVKINATGTDIKISCLG